MGAYQPEMVWNESSSRLVSDAVENHGFSLPRFLDRTKHLPPSDRVWALMTHRAFNFNGAAVHSEDIWLSRVRMAVEFGEPIQLAYPLVCKIGNPAKRMTLVGMTAGERAMVRFFKLIGQLVAHVYEPGININLLSDATLYNNALQVPPPTAYAYMNEFDALIKEEGASTWVKIHDYSSLLAPFYREFEEAYTQAYTVLGAPTDLTLNQSSRSSLPTSIRASLNSRRLGLEFAEILELFGPRQVAFSSTRRTLDNLAELALREQLAIKLACDELNIPERIWPGNIRATCHRGQKHGRSVLGLRCYPEYYGRSKLLPYHGMPLVESDGGWGPKLTILPEISLRGRSDLTRVLNDRGEPVLYISLPLTLGK